MEPKAFSVTIPHSSWAERESSFPLSQFSIIWSLDSARARSHGETGRYWMRLQRDNTLVSCRTVAGDLFPHTNAYGNVGGNAC